MNEELQTQLAANLAALQGRIAAACQRAGRDPREVTLVAVTKYVSAEVADGIAAAMQAAGLKPAIGENRLQVAAPKFEAMTARPERHFIGPLQGKKVRQVLELFDLLHSLDRMSLAERVNSRAEDVGRKRVPAFVQVNVSGEESKGGFPPSQLFTALREIEATMPRIELLGLMTMAPASDNPEDARPYFQRLAKLASNAREEGFVKAPFTALSIGMSADFEVAIECGATQIRIGSLLYAGLELEKPHE